MTLITIVKTVDSVMSSPDLVDPCNSWDVSLLIFLYLTHEVVESLLSLGISAGSLPHLIWVTDMIGDRCSPYMWKDPLSDTWFLKKTYALTDLCFWQKCCESDSWAILPYIGNSSYNLWGWCNSMILTQTEWLTREVIRVACWGGVVSFCSKLLSG